MTDTKGNPNTDGQPIPAPQMLSVVAEELASAQFIDVHTHLFMPSLGSLGLWGIDELVTYHYLEAELFRSSPVRPSEYFALSGPAKADLIWRTLFVENAPVSEATRGVISVLSAFGLSTSSDTLTEARKFFSSRDLRTHIKHVFALAGITEVVMTNDPFDPAEAALWENGAEPDPQFHAVLRLDRILKHTWSGAAEVRQFLTSWCDRMNPVYMAASLPDTFEFPDDSVRGTLLREAVLPICRERNLPLSLMIGVRYQVNPALKLAGDGSGKADLRSLENMCAGYPDNRFLASVLSRENQHEFCVYARKFSNLLPFGCWWFLNNPSVVEEITRERLEMLGTTFIPQHSDARVLEQVIYKWRNTRRTMAPILSNMFSLLIEDGRPVTRTDVRQEIDRLFRRNFEGWIETPVFQSPAAIASS